MSLSVVAVASRLVQEEIVSLFSYPIWWYSTGLTGLVTWIQDGLRYRWRKYALGLWLRHLTTPMYGEYSFLGRVVSFFMRIVVVFGRGVAWLVEAFIYALLFVIWLIWPVAALLGLLVSLASLLARGLV
jgi:hypothetical protein